MLKHCILQGNKGQNNSSNYKNHEHFGYPERVRADDGPAFRTGFTDWLKGNNIIREKSSAYNSQSNGLAVRAVKRCKDVIKKKMDEGQDWRRGSEEMRSLPSSVLDGAAPAEVFHGGRRLRSAIQPNFLPRKPVDCDRIAAFRSIINEEQAAKMKSQDLESKPLQVGQPVRMQI